MLSNTQLSNTRRKYSPRKPGPVDLYRQQRFYEITTGDREAFIGFPRRLAAWTQFHKLSSLDRV